MGHALRNDGMIKQFSFPLARKARSASFGEADLRRSQPLQHYDVIRARD